MVLGALDLSVAAAAQQTPPPKAAPVKATPAQPAVAPGRPAVGTAPRTGVGATPAGLNRVTPNATTTNRVGSTARPTGPTTNMAGGTARPGTVNMGGVPHPAAANMGGTPHPGTATANVAGRGLPPNNLAGHQPPPGLRGPGGGLANSRSHGPVVVDRPDHSRIVAERGGHGGYVQHPYSYGGHEFVHRTYVDHGHTYDRVYTHVAYNHSYLDVYAPSRFYRPGFYRWAGRPWGAPVRYSWGWAGNPWYHHYGYYFTPYPVYATPSLWLTDYLVATSLAAAYAAQSASAPPSGGSAQPGAAPMTPEVKQMIADEVKREVEQEQAQANTQGPTQTGGASTGIAGLLGDGHSHVLVAGSDLSVVDLSGRPCSITQGDVVQVNAPPAANATTVNVVVVSSKGGDDCAAAANVGVAITDLQEMQNHMRETVDQGMAEMQANQGQHGLPAVPADATGTPTQAGYAQAAPPADANAASEISQQLGADNTGQPAPVPMVASRGIDSAGDSSGGPVTIALGQSIDKVKSVLGAPLRIAIVGPRKIYQYSDMKVTFVNDRVSDVR